MPIHCPLSWRGHRGKRTCRRSPNRVRRLGIESPRHLGAVGDLPKRSTGSKSFRQGRSATDSVGSTVSVGPGHDLGRWRHYPAHRADRRGRQHCDARQSELSEDNCPLIDPAATTRPTGAPAVLFDTRVAGVDSSGWESFSGTRVAGTWMVNGHLGFDELARGYRVSFSALDGSVLQIRRGAKAKPPRRKAKPPQPRLSVRYPRQSRHRRQGDRRPCRSAW